MGETGFPTGGGGGREGRPASLVMVLRSMADAREGVLPRLYQQRSGKTGIFLLRHIVSSSRLPLTEHTGLKAFHRAPPGGILGNHIHFLH